MCVPPFQGEIFLGDRVPRVADCVLTLGCHVLPFQGISATMFECHHIKRPVRRVSWRWPRGVSCGGSAWSENR